MKFSMFKCWSPYDLIVLRILTAHLKWIKSPVVVVVTCDMPQNYFSFENVLSIETASRLAVADEHTYMGHEYIPHKDCEIRVLHTLQMRQISAANGRTDSKRCQSFPSVSVTEIKTGTGTHFRLSPFDDDWRGRCTSSRYQMKRPK